MQTIYCWRPLQGLRLRHMHCSSLYSICTPTKRFHQHVACSAGAILSNNNAMVHAAHSYQCYLAIFAVVSHQHSVRLFVVRSHSPCAMQRRHLRTQSFITNHSLPNAASHRVVGFLQFKPRLCFSEMSLPRLVSSSCMSTSSIIHTFAYCGHSPIAVLQCTSASSQFALSLNFSIAIAQLL